MCFLPCIFTNAYNCWQLIDWSTLLKDMSHIMLHMQEPMPVNLEPAGLHVTALWLQVAEAKCSSNGDHTLWPAQSRRYSYLLTTPYLQLSTQQTNAFVCPQHLTEYNAALQSTPFTSVHAECYHPRTAQDASRLSMRRTVPKKAATAIRVG